MTAHNEHRDPGPAVSALYAKLLREAFAERAQALSEGRPFGLRRTPMPSRAVDRVSNVPVRP